MAIIDKYGFVHGRCGDKVYYVLNKVQMMRSLPKKTTVEPTAAQLIQRQKFGVASRLAKLFEPYWLLGNSSFSKHGRAGYISFLLKEVVTTSIEQVVLDYSKIRFFEGQYVASEMVVVRSDLEDTITVQWKKRVGATNNKETVVHIIVYCSDLELVQHYTQAQVKKGKQQAFAINEMFRGRIIHCWSYFYSPYKEGTPSRKEQFSTTSYFLLHGF